MVQEFKSYNDYWAEVQNYFGVGDKIRMISVECLEDHPVTNGYIPAEIKEKWGDMDDLIIFYDSVGCPISAYNVDKETAIYF